MDCSRPPLYIYPQTSEQLQNNTPYFLMITGFPSGFDVIVSAEYPSFVLSVEPS